MAYASKADVAPIQCSGLNGFFVYPIQVHGSIAQDPIGAAYTSVQVCKAASRMEVCGLQRRRCSWLGWSIRFWAGGLSRQAGVAAICPPPTNPLAISNVQGDCACFLTKGTACAAQPRQKIPHGASSDVELFSDFIPAVCEVDDPNKVQGVKGAPDVVIFQTTLVHDLHHFSVGTHSFPGLERTGNFHHRIDQALKSHCQQEVEDRLPEERLS
eukprot:scaffold659_cov318-Pavlova_lutheri.AAC.12